MKKTKRCLALLLCVLLTVGTLALPAAAADGSICANGHDFRDIGAMDGTDCTHDGTINYHIMQCSRCGLTYHTAYRYDAFDKPTGKSHNFKEETVAGSCSANPDKLLTCSNCDVITFVPGSGHTWTEWTGSAGNNSCTDSYTETRSCSSCGVQESRTVSAIGHDFRKSVSSTPATCEDPGVTVMECVRCHEQKTTETPALGHLYTGDDCTAQHTCSRCGKTINGYPHSWGAYVVTPDGHYQRCQQCEATTDFTSHSDSGNGYCVCGRQVRTGPAKCSHDWTLEKRTSAFTHQEKCSLCGATRSVNCTESTLYTPRTDCTTTEYCACGNVHKSGNPKHYMGKWTQTAEGHERHCTSAGCTYTESGPHDVLPGTSCTSSAKCSVCGYVTGSGAYGDHAWGAWINSGNGTHTRKCTRPGCTAMQSATHSGGTSSGDCTSAITCADCGAVMVSSSSGHAWGHAISAGEGGHNEHCLNPGCSAARNSAHSGGTATCTSPAQCSACGGYYGSKDPSNHSGGTEIRDAKAATTEAEGYTGDTYCLGCGQKISSGASIPALSSSHTHSYASAWSKDGTHHWKDCSCGDRKDYAEHTFKDGKCTVCGEADPNYKTKEEHIHTFTESWNADSQAHWHVCTGCGETADRGEHVVITEDSVQKCGVCGITLGEIEELEKDEQKPDTQKPDTQEPDTQDPETQKPDTEEPDTQKPSTKEEFAEEAVKQFNDVVKEDAFYAAPVGWAVQNSITNGTSEENKTFSPDKTCTQAEILTMLYRAARIAEDPDFKPDGSDMKAAQAWAVENGITGADFDPNAACTRAIAVFFMWKAADSPESEGGVTFNDVTGDFEQAVAWAQAKGITNGTNLEKGLFSPDKTCNRGEIVTFLYRDQVEPLA